jgi:hypothetical protein
MVWEGSDLDEYLDHAQKAGVKTVYVRRVQLGSPEDRIPRRRERRRDDVGLVEMAFDQDGVRHIFLWRARWAKDLAVPDPSSELRGRFPRPRQPDAAVVRNLSSLLKSRSSKLVESFIRSARRHGGPFPNPDWEALLRSEFLAHLGKMYSLPSLEPDPDVPPGLATQFARLRDPVAERRLSNAVQQLSKRIRKSEGAKVRSLASECAQSVMRQGLGLRSLNLDTVRGFLQDHDCSLSDSGVRILRERATAIFKKRTNYHSHHRK